MQSISHWGQFEIQAVGTDNFKEALDPVGVSWSEFSPVSYDSKYLHGQQDYQLYFNEIPPDLKTIKDNQDGSRR